MSEADIITGAFIAVGIFGAGAVGLLMWATHVHFREAERLRRWLDHNTFEKWRARGGFTEEPPA